MPALDYLIITRLVRGHLESTHAVRGRGSLGESARVRAGGGGLNEYVRISTVYFPFLEIFSVRKKNENDGGNRCFIDVTSE